MDIDIWPWLNTASEQKEKRPRPLDADSSPVSLTILRTQGWWRWLPIIFSALVIIIFGRLLILQVVQGADFRQQTEHNRIRVQVLPAPRGAIVDRFGQALVQNAPDFSLTVTPAELPTDELQRQKILQQVVDLSQVPMVEIQSKLSDPKHRRTDPIALVDHVQ